MSDLDRAAAAVGELSASVRQLSAEVLESEHLRSSKIRWLQRLMFVLIPAVALLVVLAISNFVLLHRVSVAAGQVQSTNTLLFSCLQPGTECNKANADAIATLLNSMRQTQFVIAVCQRQNPVTTDADGKDLVRCVQAYYPGFELPQKPKAGG